MIKQTGYAVLGEFTPVADVALRQQALQAVNPGPFHKTAAGSTVPRKAVDPNNPEIKI